MSQITYNTYIASILWKKLLLVFMKTMFNLYPANVENIVSS